MGASLIPQVNRGSGVVREQADGAISEKGKKPLNPVEYRKGLPVVDRKLRTSQRPRAGHVVVIEGGPPTGIRGIREERKAGMRET